MNFLIKILFSEVDGNFSRVPDMYVYIYALPANLQFLR